MIVSEQLARLESFDSCLAYIHTIIGELGFKTLIYDYTPVPMCHKGSLITPTVFKTFNAPSDMPVFWCESGYYQIDPVQQRAAQRVTPFVWSFGSHNSEWYSSLTPAHRPVARYVSDHGLTTGLTVPLHLPDGSFATFTAIVESNYADAEHQAQKYIGVILLLAHALQTKASELLVPSDRCCAYIKLTRRERECLQLSAKGLTAKGIAATLNRSNATINLHLVSAARKLGARNRVEAVVRALHYRLVEC